MEFSDKTVGFFRSFFEFICELFYIDLAEILDLVVDDLTEDGALSIFVYNLIEFFLAGVDFV